ncbi:auxin efflux carrier [Dichomitus squalens]|uniref:Auxin efflux carrier n=2 Tax=Dichomitus squalens TaxID=114155 RepID=A0A4V2K352_9APHY|nr:auxin efflux carrier [Dichomitus squalens LYAD-421 SS1]EJF62213.1 auxin efflux carrier [Dichomitus squalens LYAD-421 SS1]TBU39193.1 auxin efflux carrier [Dichomitus squalens]TBU53543.1 auxin efflux carrier [Dichomitus squalens]
MPSAAFLVYSGIMPLLKTFFTIIAGYAAAKMGMFPPAASRGTSHITMNMALPALIFANVVPAFTPSNISALGPLFLIAFTYQAIGFLSGLIIREVCYVPRNFWQGVIVMTGMSNWGNLPTAVVLSITQQAPFNPATDPALGVSYVSIFIVSYHLVFWMGGAAHSLSWDFRPGVPQGEAAEVRVSWKEKPIGSLITRYILRQEPPNSFAAAAIEADKTKDIEESFSEKEKNAGTDGAIPVSELRRSEGIDDTAESDPDVQLARRTSRISTASVPMPHRRPSLSAAAAPSAIPSAPPPSPAQSARDLETQSIAQRSETLHTPTLPQKIVRVFRPLGAIVTPVTCTLAVSLPIALVQPLKALFVDVSATGGPSFKGPDGRPPLAFMIDTANFMGGITVPLALVLLGASFARIKLPRPLSRLPIMAMFLSTFAKMIMLPVIGIFLVQAMTGAGLVQKDEKALRFVMMFLSGTPTAVNQLIVASLYAPDGNVDNLSACLLVQYIFMFIASSALTAVALLLL